MHELSVVKSILDICLRYAKTNEAFKIISIELKIGELSDLEPIWIQRYFDLVSRNTIAEGAKLKIERIPVILRCSECSDTFSFNVREIDGIDCPRCGSKKCTVISGREYFIGNMEVI